MKVLLITANTSPGDYAIAYNRTEVLTWCSNRNWLPFELPDHSLDYIKQFIRQNKIFDLVFLVAHGFSDKVVLGSERKREEISWVDLGNLFKQIHKPLCIFLISCNSQFGAALISSICQTPVVGCSQKPSHHDVANFLNKFVLADRSLSKQDLERALAHTPFRLGNPPDQLMVDGYPVITFQNGKKLITRNLSIQQGSKVMLGPENYGTVSKIGFKSDSLGYIFADINPILPPPTFIELFPCFPPPQAHFTAKLPPLDMKPALSLGDVEIDLFQLQRINPSFSKINYIFPSQIISELIRDKSFNPPILVIGPLLSFPGCFPYPRSFFDENRRNSPAPPDEFISTVAALVAEKNIQGVIYLPGDDCMRVGISSYAPSLRIHYEPSTVRFRRGHFLFWQPYGSYDQSDTIWSPGCSEEDFDSKIWKANENFKALEMFDTLHFLLVGFAPWQTISDLPIFSPLLNSTAKITLIHGSLDPPFSDFSSTTATLSVAWPASVESFCLNWLFASSSSPLSKLPISNFHDAINRTLVKLASDLHVSQDHPLLQHHIGFMHLGHLARIECLSATRSASQTSISVPQLDVICSFLSQTLSDSRFRFLASSVIRILPVVTCDRSILVKPLIQLLPLVCKLYRDSNTDSERASTIATLNNMIRSLALTKTDLPDLIATDLVDLVSTIISSQHTSPLCFQKCLWFLQNLLSHLQVLKPFIERQLFSQLMTFAFDETNELFDRHCCLWSLHVFIKSSLCQLTPTIWEKLLTLLPKMEASVEIERHVLSEGLLLLIDSLDFFDTSLFQDQAQKLLPLLSTEFRRSRDFGYFDSTHTNYLLRLACYGFFRVYILAIQKGQLAPIKIFIEQFGIPNLLKLKFEQFPEKDQFVIGYVHLLLTFPDIPHQSVEVLCSICKTLWSGCDSERTEKPSAQLKELYLELIKALEPTLYLIPQPGAGPSSSSS